MLEAAQHGDNCFLTLTYDDASLPCSSVSGLSSLVPEHLQMFLKRLRKCVEPRRIRFYAVGEYGDESFRPHYHAALFNFPSCDRGFTLRLPGSGSPRWEKCCDTCRLVGRTWGHGNVDLGMLETKSAQYLCGYVTKKMTRGDDPRLEGRWPEFARMSLRPGIGHSAMHEVASQTLRFNLVDAQGDVTSTLRHGSRIMPLGRYLRRTLRKMVGVDEAAPLSTVLEAQKEMLPLRLAARNDKKNPSLKAHYLAAKKGKIAKVLAREKIHRQRKGKL